MHQLRVAGVAWLICDHLKEPVDTKNVVTACLLHDMGNIIKFKLDLFPENLKPEGLAYWQQVQDEYRQKYGMDEHLATIEIAKEIGVSDEVLLILEKYGFSKAKITNLSRDFSFKIAAYSDHRVSPVGVVSLVERLEEARKRYVGVKYDEKSFAESADFWQKTERQIIGLTDITPDFVTNERVEEIIGKLGGFEVELKGGK